MSVGRPKGKQYFPVSLTLTQAQIDYLAKQPNASELVRRILDDLISAGDNIEEKASALSLNIQLETLKSEYEKLMSKRWGFLESNNSTLTMNPDGTVNPLNDSEDARVAVKVLQGYDDKRHALMQRIVDLKKKILET